MSSESATPANSRNHEHPRPSYLAWLAICVVSGLLIAPVFDAMPPRVKFLGLHSWALAVCVAATCAWAARWQRIRSPRLVSLVSVCVTLAALLLQAHWGFSELKQATSRRMPMLPLPQQASSPEEIARSVQLQKELTQALVPTFTDYQKRRMNSPLLRRVRPLVLWSGELLIAAIVSVVVSRVCLRHLHDDIPASPRSA